MSKAHIGSLLVDFDALTIEGQHGACTVEPKVMELLQLLASAPGEVFTRDAIIDVVWDGTFGGDERLSRAVSLLRKALGDERGQPGYILTIPRRGYRLIAAVKPFEAAGSETKPAPTKADAPVPPARTFDRGQVPTLAVLPLLNMSGKPEVDLFAFGVVEDVVEALCKGTTAQVKASSATARYGQAPNIDLKGLAHDLQVRYAMHGSLRNKGEAMLLTVQLIDADNGDLLWTERFEIPHAPLGGQQEGLARQLAAHLRFQTYRVESERILRQPSDATAWDAVMRSLAAVQKMTGPSILQAISDAERAIEIDPEYGLAHALLAQQKAILYFQAVAHSPEVIASIRLSADRALALDPDESLVLGSVGSALALIGSPEVALGWIQRAIKLNPGNQFAYSSGVVAATLLDRNEDAQRYFDKCFELSVSGPTAWSNCIWLAHAHIRAGNWTAAERAATQALDIAPALAGSFFVISIISRQAGQQNSAVEYFVRGRRLEPETPLEMWLLRFGRAYAGNQAWSTFRNHFESLWKQTQSAL